MQPVLQPNAPTLSKSKVFFYIFTILIFGGLIYYFSEIKGSVELLRQVQPAWLIVAFAMQCGTYLFGSLSYSVLLRIFRSDPRIPIRELYQASIVALFLNQTIPSAGVSGNMFFFGFLKRRGVDEDRALPLILVELLSFYAANVTAIVVLLGSALVVRGIPGFFAAILVAGIGAFGLFAVIIGLIGKGNSIRWILRKLSRVRFLRKPIARYEAMQFDHLRSPWHLFVTHTSIVVRSTLYQVCLILCDTVTIVALFRGLGTHVSFLHVLFVLMLTHIVALLPISPGALIVFEGSMTFFFTSLGVPVAVAAIVTLLYRLLSFWLPIPLGYFLYRKLRHQKAHE